MPTSESDPHSSDDDLQNLEWLTKFDMGQFFSLLSPETENEKSDNESSFIDRSVIDTQQRRKPLQCTFSCMIFRAIEESSRAALPLQSIYRWIDRRYGDFLKGTQWKNSVRHSLSYNLCFIRLRLGPEGPRDRANGHATKASWWTIHPDCRRAYAHGVLAEGSAHTCPLKISDQKSLFKVFSRRFTRIDTSEHELAVLADDINTAATILSLKEPLRNDRKKKSRNSNKKIQKRVECKKAPQRQVIIPCDMPEDHRYAFEASEPDFSNTPSSNVRTVCDASVQACFADFEPERQGFAKRVKPE